ncbi:hypothetical protein EJ05DRAFT_118924 [Pseudovirgaria hyperparasitica]|uniref:Uncharacterized protein n=1 Tax=Pseudovirgaria hyperparasitica TaxID=470096 RepID=A0A6A6VYR7_9PEZI|nr:uncharacterized protein EJ05DRAFT_118924 [Pseudovirgaria hyperparasitica]KAF2755009.1 hypothetical protein EJ05DRAFT_118924 [Pseudovirgaria hyperparasitica]
MCKGSQVPSVVPALPDKCRHIVIVIAILVVACCCHSFLPVDETGGALPALHLPDTHYLVNLEWPDSLTVIVTVIVIHGATPPDL